MNNNQIFEFFEKKLEDNYNLIRDRIGEEIIILGSQDNDCLRCGLRRDNQVIRRQICFGCRLLNYLSGKDLVKDEINIEWGRLKGEKIYIDRNISDSSELELDHNLKNYNNKLTSGISNYYDKEYFKLNNIYYYKIKNKFLNLSINSIIMKYIMLKKNYPNNISYLYNYNCSYKSNILRFKYEFEDIDNLKLNPIYGGRKKLDNQILLDIFSQLTIFFKFIANFYFCHNQSSIEYLKFSSDMCNLNFDGIEYRSAIKLFILPSVYSSISLYNSQAKKWARFFNSTECKDYHLYPIESVEIDINGSKNYNNKRFKIPYAKDYTDDRIIFYKLGNRSDDFLTIRRNYGSTILSSSFDLVCFVISLLLEDYVRNSFEKEEKMMRLWSGMWRKKESVKIWNEISNYEGENNFEYVFELVSKYYIRFDLLDYFYHTIFDKN